MQITIREWLTHARQHLQTDASFDRRAAGYEATLLLSRAAGLTHQQLITRDDQPLSALALSLASRWLGQRLAGYPIAQLIGEQPFWDVDLQITPWVLIPRQDTETAIDVIRSLDLPATTRVLDMATGSGAIALALRSTFPAWRISASDVSHAALATAKLNARRLGVDDMQWHHSDWFANLPTDQRFDLIVSNPPYIEADHPLMMAGDVRFEPDIALMDGSNDGLTAIRHIIDTARDCLDPDGWLVLEHGYQQAPAVQALMIEAEYQSVRTEHDYGNNPRITLGQKLQSRGSN